MFRQIVLDQGIAKLVGVVICQQEYDRILILRQVFAELSGRIIPDMNRVGRQHRMKLHLSPNK